MSHEFFFTAKDCTDVNEFYVQYEEYRYADGAVGG